MEKALREAKRNTNWVEQNAELGGTRSRGFCARALLARARSWRTSSRSSRGVAARRRADRARAAGAEADRRPGVPDIYQGDELPFRALVDPDNRRPVDWDWQQAMLRRLMGGSPPAAETRKLLLTLRLLGLRARRPDAVRRRLRAARRRPGRVRVRARRRGAGRGRRARWRVWRRSVEAPRGRWRDVLRGEQRSFGRQERLAGLVGEHGFAVFERLSG